MDAKKDVKQPGGRRPREEQGKIRSAVHALLREGLSPEEICSRLAISQNTFYYHVRRLRAAGNVYPGLSSRRGRPPKSAGENAVQIAAQWLAVKEQSRDREISRLLMYLLEEAYSRQLIDLQVYRDPLPHQSPVLERHPRINGYDLVTALSTEDLRFLRALVDELMKNGPGKDQKNLSQILSGALGEREKGKLLAIARTLKTFDLTNLRENARRILDN